MLGERQIHENILSRSCPQCVVLLSGDEVWESEVTPAERLKEIEKRFIQIKLPNEDVVLEIPNKNLISAREDLAWLILRVRTLTEALEVAKEGLKDFYLSHEHLPDLPHTRAMGDTYGWCDFCSTKVSWGLSYAEEILKDIEEIESGK